MNPVFDDAPSSLPEKQSVLDIPYRSLPLAVTNQGLARAYFRSFVHFGNISICMSFAMQIPLKPSYNCDVLWRGTE